MPQPRTIPCPACGAPLNPAALLGRLNTGKRKLTKADRNRRRKALAVARAKRWNKKEGTP